MSLPARTWPKEFLLRYLFAWCMLYITTLSFDYSVLPNVTNWFGNFFYSCAAFSGKLFFGVTLSGGPDFYSDSLLVYLHVFNISIISLLIGIVWAFFAKKNFTATMLWPLLLTTLRYFVALMLFAYGFSKIYKWQFFSPEPNTLYQTVGNTPRDLLYWTSMGTSYTYSMFMGVIEVIPALLLLFRRTTLAGALIAALVMMNVLFVNLGFDITVKLHSFTLLLMCGVIISPAAKRVFRFFNGQTTETWSYPSLRTNNQYRKLLMLLKLIAIILILTEANYRYFEAANFNNDVAEKPPLYGAYMVTDVDLDPNNPARDHGIYIEDERAPTIDKIFFHSRGYIIFDMSDHTLRDYSIALDTVAHIVTLTDSVEFFIPKELEWTQYDDSTFSFEGECNGTVMRWNTIKADLKKLPLLQQEFTWVDQ